MKCVICNKKKGKPYFCKQCFKAMKYLKENIDIR